MEQNFTPLEQQIINAMRAMLTGGQDQIFIGDLQSETRIPASRLRGAMASLIQKRVLDVNRQDGGLISLLID